ncbi:MAG TPA: hypothetical protein VI564_02270 [Candidatus Nanoarchaeia archaeon]|nr:hypothetical protein [Candidatus Nanoarchaeia archaeon]
MALNTKDLSKLSPEERISRLKALETENKKKLEEQNREIDEIGKLIKDSIKELNTNKIANEIAPNNRVVDISRLFEPQDNETISKDRPDFFDIGTESYRLFSQLNNDYKELKQFDGIISGGYALNENQRNMLGMIGERINTIEKYMTESEKQASKLDASKSVLYKLKKETGLD